MSSPPVDYIDVTRRTYDDLGYPAYRWVYSEEPPAWSLPRRPLPKSRVGLVASGGIYRSGQVAFHFRDIVDGNRQAVVVDNRSRRRSGRSDVVSAAGNDRRVDPDQSAGGIEQRPAGVAGVDGRVCLDGLGDGEGGERRDCPPHRADNAFRKEEPDGQLLIEARTTTDLARGAGPVDLVLLTEAHEWAEALWVSGSRRSAWSCRHTTRRVRLPMSMQR